MSESEEKCGRVLLCGDELQVSFRFDKRRFEAIKRFAGASYDKECRRWRLPLLQLEKLRESKLFSSADMKYEFDAEEANRRLEDCRARVQKAAENIASNPFSAAEADLALACPEAVFRLAVSGFGLRAHAAPRSKARRMLETSPEVHYLKDERSYFFPAAGIKEFLQQARAAGIEFAVAAEAGERLRRTAALRAAIVAGKRKGTLEEYQECLLAPCLSVEGAWFSLHGCTPEHLRDWLPGTRGAEARRRAAARIDPQAAIRLGVQLQRSRWKLWLTKEACAALDSIRTANASLIDDLAVLLNPPPRCWICDVTGGGLLLRDREAVDELNLSAKQRQRWIKRHPQFSEDAFICPPGSKLIEFYNRISSSLGTFPASPVFTAFLRDTERRQEQMVRCRRYSGLSDIALDLKNSELKTKLFAHQRIAVAWLLETPRAFLGDDMGLG